MKRQESDNNIIVETDYGHDHFEVRNLEDIISFRVTPGEIRRLAYWPKQDIRLLINALERLETESR